MSVEIINSAYIRAVGTICVPTARGKK